MAADITGSARQFSGDQDVYLDHDRVALLFAALGELTFSDSFPLSEICKMLRSVVTYAVTAQDGGRTLY